MTVARDVLDEAVKDLLEAQMPSRTGVWVGISDPPSRTPEMPYLVLYPMMSSPTEGDLKDGEDQRDYIYQISCIGTTPQQTTWCSSKAQNIITGRPASASGYLHTLPVAGTDITFRVSDNLGAVHRSGDRLYKVDDVYRIRALTS